MSNPNERPLAFGVYDATPEFQSIQQHSCVCYADDLGLVAVTGPADDVESQQFAELFAAAPKTAKERDHFKELAGNLLNFLIRLYNLFPDCQGGAQGDACKETREIIAKAKKELSNV